jgi:tetratricopeptide (TPR) repeat protein
MSYPVFISYARSVSTNRARALADKLAGQSFLDTDAVEYGEEFPPLILQALLAARVVVVFASSAYMDRPFCRLELKLALAGGDPAASHIIVALEEGSDGVLATVTPDVAERNWPLADETADIAALVRRRLGGGGRPIGTTLSVADANRIAKVFLEESLVPPPLDFGSIPRSLPPGIEQSIGPRFVGRAGDLRRLHRTLSGSAARLTSRIAAGAGFGKTRIAIEYLHRYGPKYYSGGLFWINAAASSLEEEYCRVLAELDQSVSDLASMRQQKRDVRHELELALRRIAQRGAVLFIVDNVPETAPGERARTISEYCPATGYVNVLATSRQDTPEPGVRGLRVDTLNRDGAILLLTEGVPGWGRHAWEQWGRVAEWVGDLPIALELLNRCLALGSISADELVRGAESQTPAGATAQLDTLREALRGQIPEGAVFGATEAFGISFQRLSDRARHAAMVLAQFGPAPIPEDLVEALGSDVCGPAERTALRSRHFVTASGDGSFGVMHRLTADFLRAQVGEAPRELIRVAGKVLASLLDPNRCRDSRQWKQLNPLRQHAEAVWERARNDDELAALVSEAVLRAAFLAREQGDFAAARRLEEQVVPLRQRIWGEENRDTLTSMNNLAETLRLQGDPAGARALHERVLDVRRRVLGEEDLDTLTSKSHLAKRLPLQGDLAGARELHERVLDVRRRLLGEEHLETLTSMNNLAMTLRLQGDLAGARELQKRVLDVRRRVLDAEHPDTLTSMNDLAATIWSQGDYSTAGKLEKPLLEVRRRVLGNLHPDTLTSIWNYARTLMDLGERAESVRLLRECLEGCREKLGENHPTTVKTANYLHSLGLDADAATPE